MHLFSADVMRKACDSRLKVHRDFEIYEVKDV
jgi:hypothetical protein